MVVLVFISDIVYFQDGSNSSIKQPTPSGSAEKPKKRVLEGSVVAEDMKMGHGPEAKTGKMVRSLWSE